MKFAVVVAIIGALFALAQAHPQFGLSGSASNAGASSQTFNQGGGFGGGLSGSAASAQSSSQSFNQGGGFGGHGGYPQGGHGGYGHGGHGGYPQGGHGGYGHGGHGYHG